MKIAIGFVNQFYTPQLTIGVIDLETAEFGWIMNSAIDEATAHVRGVNGMLRVDDYLLVGYQSYPTTFIVFDRNFQIVGSTRFNNIFEVHSLCHHDDGALCVSTGRDEVFRLEVSDIGQHLPAKRWYQHGARILRSDGVHLNSIASDSNRVLVSCFGPKSSGSWANSRSGQIIDLISGDTIREGLYQPHSVMIHRGQWWVCESGTGRILGENGEVVEVGGYVRGLVPINQSVVCVASSAQRIQSRSKGTLNVGCNDSVVSSKSFVHLVDLDLGEVVKSIELTKYGAEIFELMPLETDFCPAWIFQSDPMDIQVGHLERQLLKLRKSSIFKNRLTRRLRNRLIKIIRI